MLDRKKEIGKAEKKRRGRETPVACRRREKKKTDIVVLPSQNAQFHDFIPIAPKRRERFKHDQSFRS
jgi:hypothetical protein